MSTAGSTDRDCSRPAFDGGMLTAPDALAEVRQLLFRFGGNRIRIYEAGGGPLSPLPPELTRSADITVVDIDDTQLQNNYYAGTKIRGDIQDPGVPPNSFDLVVCYDVIEHLEQARQSNRPVL